MHERPTHSRMQASRTKKPVRNKGKNRQPVKRKPTTVVSVGSGAPANRAKVAMFYYGSGYSCEQALYAAFADLLGMSLAKASQAAPLVKDRGDGCGAFDAGIALLARLYTAGDGEDAAETAVAEFKRLFMERYGSEDCASIQAAQRRDCLDVIGKTARMIDVIISRYLPK